LNNSSLSNASAQQQRRPPSELNNDYIEIDKTSSSGKPNFKQIRIKIDNDYRPSNTNNMVYNSSSFETNSKSSVFTSNSQRANNPKTSKSNYDNDVEMSMESDSLYPGNSKMSSRLNNNITLNSGYKLMVSNLHPRVTEDDVLVNFFEIKFFLRKSSLITIPFKIMSIWPEI
jgi:hypothetical protein